MGSVEFVETVVTAWCHDLEAIFRWRQLFKC